MQPGAYVHTLRMGACTFGLLCVYQMWLRYILLVVCTPDRSSMKDDDILTWCTQDDVIENSEVKCIPCINI